MLFCFGFHIYSKNVSASNFNLVAPEDTLFSDEQEWAKSIVLL